MMRCAVSLPPSCVDNTLATIDSGIVAVSAPEASAIDRSKPPTFWKRLTTRRTNSGRNQNVSVRMSSSRFTRGRELAIRAGGLLSGALGRQLGQAGQLDELADHGTAAGPRDRILQRACPGVVDEQHRHRLSPLEIVGEAEKRGGPIAAQRAPGGAAALGRVEPELEQGGDQPPGAVAAHGDGLELAGVGVAVHEQRLEDAQG